MIQLTNVSKSYNKGAVQAVKNLTLTVEPGKLFGFLGPNGAGKTTTIKMIVGLLHPDAGGISVCGRDALKEPLAVKRLTGFVPDSPFLYSRMSGMAYLRFIADVFRMPVEARERVVPPLLKQFGLEDAAGSPVASYSHGMRQKLAVVAALMHEPEVLIMDEPISGLDPLSAFQLKEIMRGYCARGKTVFFSTHVMEVAERICDVVGIISKGELVACAPFPDLKRQMGEQDATLEQIFLELTHAEQVFGSDTDDRP